MQILNEANKNYNLGNYKEALMLYYRAAEMYGNHLVKVNISMCKDKLNNYDVLFENYINDYFDNIYLVSLPKDKNRYFKTAAQCKKIGVNYSLFPAINGYSEENIKLYNDYSKKIGELKRYEKFNDLEVKRGKRFIESPGAIGYIKTYIKILEDAKKRDYKRILIIEDDVIFKPDFHIQFDKFIKKVGSDWKILQLGASQYDWSTVDFDKALVSGFYLPRQLDTCGSFAIAIDNSIFDELIEIQSYFESPFDHLALGEIYEKYMGQCFVCYPNIVMPDVGRSTIRDSRNQKTHSVKMRWQLKDFPYPLSNLLVNIVISSIENLSYVSQFDFTNMPFDLNLYYLSSDGLRPIHNIECLFESIIYPSSSDISMDSLGGDVTLLVKDTSYKITEYDLITLIQDYLSNGNIEDHPRYTLICQEAGVVPGRVSIIIPTYKRPKNLKNAIQSVLDQDYINKEIIVIDDNGEDITFDLEIKSIISSFRKKYPSINIVYYKHNKNRNGAAARNTGILMSTGEFICFLDDDDVYLNERLSESINILEKYKNDNTIGAVYCGFLGWNSPVNDLNRYKEGDLTKELLLLEYKKHYLHTNTATYKRDAIFRLNGFDESYVRHQDLEFNLRFFQKYLVKSLKKACVKLNPAPSNISNKIYNLDMLFLKKKFLKQFNPTIERYSEDIQHDIYKKHWLETKRYINDKTEFNSYIALDIKNAEFQIYSLLNHS